MPEKGAESIRQNPVSAIAHWLDLVDILGTKIPVQPLTDKPMDHPLRLRSFAYQEHLLNLQIASIVVEVLNKPDLFDPSKVADLLERVSNPNSLSDEANVVSPKYANGVLVRKQEGYLPKGESWQFAKQGLEVSSQSQQIGYKLHAIQELIEPIASANATKYEDQIADILTAEILSKADRFKLLAHAIGPYPASVRWIDFLEGAENPTLFTWIKALQFFTDKKEYQDILLSIAATHSLITPNTVVQLLERKTFRSTGKYPPLRPEEVTDPHKHDNKIELYLPLMGPGMLKVQFAGEKQVQTFTPDPNMPGSINLAELGADVSDGIPTLIYRGKRYQPEGHFINVPLENSKTTQWIVVMPGDIHDYQNVGISPDSAFALTLGFPKSREDSIEGDFISQAFAR